MKEKPETAPEKVYSKFGYSKKRNDVLSLEDVKVNVHYALTINPNDQHQYFGEPRRELLFNADLKDSFFPTEIERDLYMEVSPKGRLHWHGLLLFREREEIFRFYTRVISNWIRESTVTLKAITSMEDWLKYCKKQELFHDILKDKFGIETPNSFALPKECEVDYEWNPGVEPLGPPRKHRRQRGRRRKEENTPVSYPITHFQKKLKLEAVD